MGYLVDWQIRELCETTDIVTPYAPELVNQASLDVRLGTDLLVSIPQTNRKDPAYIHRVTLDGKDWMKMDLLTCYWYTMYPGARALGHTVEVFNLPPDILAFFHLKSSRAREGIGHPISGLCDPGWSNSSLTLELTNTDPHDSFNLYNNLLIGQITFYKLDSLPQVSYNNKEKGGHYNGDLSVTASKTSKVEDKIWQCPDYLKEMVY